MKPFIFKETKFIGSRFEPFQNGTDNLHFDYVYKAVIENLQNKSKEYVKELENYLIDLMYKEYKKSAYYSVYVIDRDEYARFLAHMLPKWMKMKRKA